MFSCSETLSGLMALLRDLCGESVNNHVSRDVHSLQIFWTVIIETVFAEA